MGEAARKRKMVGRFLPVPTVDTRTGQNMGPARYGGSLVALEAEYQKAGQKTPIELHPPCGPCRNCCWHACVDVDPDNEKPEDLAHLELVDNPKGGLKLKKRADGACVHLGEEGCTVYQHRPRACRAYDCRLMSACGVADSYDNGRVQPSWIFDNDKRSRILQTALRLGAAKTVYVDNSSAAQAVAAAFASREKNIPIAAKLIEKFDALPLAQQRELMEELSSQVSKSWK